MPDLGTASNENCVMYGPIKQVASLHLTYLFSVSPSSLSFFVVVLVFVVGILTCHLRCSFYITAR